jgi:hypothetical protein
MVLKTFAPNNSISRLFGLGDGGQGKRANKYRGTPPRLKPIRSMNLRSGRNTGRGNSLLLGYYNRFQDGEFAKHGDLHGGAGVDGPVIARYSLGHLSVNRGRDFPTQ